MNATYLFQVIWNIVLISLFLMTYAYLDKLEKTGCECSAHPYRNFVKQFPLWAVAFIVVFMFLPFNLIESLFGSAGKMVHGLLVFFFGIVSIVFYVMAFIYTRWLIMEKCKCSEDTRREVIYVWSLLTIILLVLFFVLALAQAMTVGDRGVDIKSALKETSRVGRTTIESPVQRLRDIRKGFRKLR